MARRRAIAGVQRAVRRDDQADQEQVDNVEDEDTPDNLLRSPGDLLGGVLGLSCGKADELGTGIGEGGSDEDTTEAVEAVQEGGPRCVPVSGTNVASVVGWDTTTVDDNSENNETQTGSDLDDTDDEFDLSMSACFSEDNVQ